VANETLSFSITAVSFLSLLLGPPSSPFTLLKMFGHCLRSVRSLRALSLELDSHYHGKREACVRTWRPWRPYASCNQLASAKGVSFIYEYRLIGFDDAERAQSRHF